MFTFSTTFFRSLYDFNTILRLSLDTPLPLIFHCVKREHLSFLLCLKVASTTLLVISGSGNHSLFYTLVSSRYCSRKFLIVLLSSIRSSCRMDFILHSRRFSMYFLLHSKIVWCTVSSTLHSSQLLPCEGDVGGECLNLLGNSRILSRSNPNNR